VYTQCNSYKFIDVPVAAEVVDSVVLSDDDAALVSTVAFASEDVV